MRHAFKYCAVAIGAVLGVGDRAAAQCFVCSDANQNTSVGANAIGTDSGTANTAVGFAALESNTSGLNNTAFGVSALSSNTVGKGNAAQGVNSLYANTTGIRNVAIGNNALYANTTGGYNIGVGFDAGFNITTGSNNIEIGTPGTAGDSGTIQIGSQGVQTSTTIAGIFGTTLTGSAVYVTAAGKLGVLASAERYKTEVETLSDGGGKLGQLRPVTFKLKTDPSGTVQYGLIAEEVAKVYPELVIRGADGRIEGVRYEELSPLLLSVVQQQQRQLQVQDSELHRLAARDELQAAQIHDLNGLQERFAEQTGQLRDLQRQLADLRASLSQSQSTAAFAARR